MNGLKTSLRYLWLGLWYAFALSVVLLAAVFSTVRLMLPYANDYNAALAQQLSVEVGRPVTIGSLGAEWHGWTPSLVLNDVRLRDPQDYRTLFQLDKTRVDLHLLRSLVSGQPVFSRIILLGVDLQVARDVDGRIRLVGLGEGPPLEREDLDQILDWLLAQGWVSLEDSSITWDDRLARGGPLHFPSVTLALRNDDAAHRLDVRLALPPDLGASLSLQLAVQGDPRDVANSRFAVHLRGEAVDLARLAPVFRMAAFEVAPGRGSFELWGRWQAGALQQVQGDIDLRDPSLTPLREATPAPIPFGRLAGRFLWQREAAADTAAAGWRFEAKDLVVNHGGRTALPARVSLHYQAAGAGAASVQASASYLELEHVAALAGRLAADQPSWREMLGALSPRGQALDTQITWRGGAAAEYRLYTHVRQASLQPWQRLPAADNVEGQLWLQGPVTVVEGAPPLRGALVLKHAALTLDLPAIFRAPLSIDSLLGRFAWQVEAGRWRLSGRELVAANRDLSARASLDLEQDAPGRSPFLALVTSVQRGDGRQLAHYLPAGIMGRDAVEFLDRGIRNGRVVAGGVLFHGRLTAFPFDRGDGRFEAAFRVEQGELRYAEGWPEIREIAADVQFAGRGLAVEAQQGRIFSNQIQRASVRVPDVTAHPLRLSISGKVQGPTQDKLDYLIKSPPLHAAIGQHLTDLRAGGDSDLQLELALTVGDQSDTLVNGTLTLRDNSLALAPLGEVLAGVNGELHFTEAGLEAPAIKARLLGQEATLAIVTEQTPQQDRIQVRTQGPFRAPEVAARYLAGAERYVSGRGRWEVALSVPLKTKSGTPGVTRLRLGSDLQGVGLALPAPFAKPAAEARPLSLQVDFPPAQKPLARLAYHDVFSAAFELGAADQAANRGEFRFQTGTAGLPREPGYRLDARLEEFSLPDWQALWPAAPGDGAVGGGFLSAFNAISVQTGRFTGFGQQLNQARLEARRDQGGWRAQVDSIELQGVIQVPNNLSLFPIHAELSRWYPVLTGRGEGRLDPRTVPALNLKVEDFRYKERRFGKTELRTSKVVNGLRFDQMTLRPEGTHIALRGSWVVAGGGQQSNLILNLASDNVQQTLQALGYVGTIEDGSGNLTLDLKWPASLLEATPANIQGRVQLDLKDGRLLDVDPGAGRLFGLLSLQMLPRRLLLDFSDVFKKGFGFERIEGSFDIGQGSAHIGTLYLKGPSARVDVSGRVDLVNEQYDQIVTVTPHLSDALPVLGALAVAPQVGAAILFVQKLFKLDIDKATQIQYSITGDWKNPVIEPLKKPGGQPQTEVN